MDKITVADWQKYVEMLFPVAGIIISLFFMIIVIVIMFKSLKTSSVSDMFKEDGTDKLSMTRFWTNVAYACATFAFMSINFYSIGKQIDLTMIWLIYMGTVASNAVASKWIASKYDAAKFSMINENQRNVMYGSRYSNTYQRNYNNFDTPTSIRRKMVEDGGGVRADNPDV